MSTDDRTRAAFADEQARQVTSRFTAEAIRDQIVAQEGTLAALRWALDQAERDGAARFIAALLDALPEGLPADAYALVPLRQAVAQTATPGQLADVLDAYLDALVEAGWPSPREEAG